MKPSITVLTTVYNGHLYLEEAIDSILNQTCADFEFIIIDDASTDNSLKIIRSYNDSRIRLIQNYKNMGQTASLNIGLKLAKGKYIARLDQDDVSMPKRLEEQLAYMEEHPELTIVSSWEYTINAYGKRVRTWKSCLDNYGAFLGAIILGLCPIWHPSVMFRKEDILKLNGFDVSYGPAEDYELWSRIAMNRLNAGFVPQFHLLQRVHGEQQSVLKSDKQLASIQRAHLKVIEHYMPDITFNYLDKFLRFEKNIDGCRHNKKMIREAAINLYNLLCSIKSKEGLSEAEYKSLTDKIYNRLGFGVRYALILTRLPSILFYPFFYVMSPSYIPNMRAVASKMNNIIQHLFKFN